MFVMLLYVDLVLSVSFIVVISYFLVDMNDMIRKLGILWLTKSIFR